MSRDPDAPRMGVPSPGPLFWASCPPAPGSLTWASPPPACMRGSSPGIPHKHPGSGPAAAPLPTGSPQAASAWPGPLPSCTAHLGECPQLQTWTHNGPARCPCAQAAGPQISGPVPSLTQGRCWVLKEEWVASNPDTQALQVRGGTQGSGRHQHMHTHVNTLTSLHTRMHAHVYTRAPTCAHTCTYITRVPGSGSQRPVCASVCAHTSTTRAGARRGPTPRAACMLGTAPPRGPWQLGIKADPTAVQSKKTGSRTEGDRARSREDEDRRGADAAVKGSLQGVGRPRQPHATPRTWT